MYQEISHLTNSLQMLQEKIFSIVLTLSFLVKEELWLWPRKMFSNQLNTSFINAVGTLQLFILVEKVLTNCSCNESMAKSILCLILVGFKLKIARNKTHLYHLAPSGILADFYLSGWTKIDNSINKLYWRKVKMVISLPLPVNLWCGSWGFVHLCNFKVGGEEVSSARAPANLDPNTPVMQA